MDQVAYIQQVNERLEKIKETLAVKGLEYHRNNNPFHNFEVGAAMENINPYRILHNMFLKHYISYKDMLNDLDNEDYLKDEYIEEKLGDMINYLIIQELLIKEWNSKTMLKYISKPSA